MPSREELLQSIHPGMKLDKAFFLRVYGYEITWPGFAEQAIAVLAQAGCSKARAYYDSIVQEYEAQYSAEFQDTARRYWAECEKDWKKKQKEGAEQRSQQKDSFLMRRKERLTDLIKRLESR